MNRQHITLFALVLALPGLAWSQPTAKEACEALKSKAADVLGTTDALRCEAQGDTLKVTAPSVEAYESMRMAAFPDQKFQGYTIAKPFQALQPMRDAVASPSIPSESLAKFSPAVFVTPGDVNYDNGGAYGGLFMPVGGPPGHGSVQPTPDVDQAPVRRGPPGHGSTQQPQAPANTPAGGPPGHRPPSTQQPGGNDVPPPADAPPPSRPTPVFVPAAPPPNYWNTIDWGTVPMWSSLPNDWESATVDEANGRYVSRWYAYSRPFIRSLGYETVSRDGYHRRDSDEVAMTLSSRQELEYKQCYYQAVYSLRWNSFEGSWDGRFSHYRAACKADRQYDDSNTARVARPVVRFEMNGQKLMPWESETVRFTFDGQRVTTRVLNPAYQYRADAEQMTYEAGDKVLTAPDESGVTVDLIANGRSMTMRVNDKWAGYYAGETLEVSARLMRVNNSWNPFASNFEEGKFEFQNGSQLRFKSEMPAGGPGAGANYDTQFGGKTCGKYYVDNVSFRRANNGQSDNKSRISSDRIVSISGSRRIEICR